MFRKFLIIPVLVITAAAILTGCAGSVKNSGIAGKSFVYEKEGFPDEFSIRLDNDGCFTYYEGFYSSYVGNGSWQLNGDILTLREENVPTISGKIDHVYRFNVNDDGSLSFISENSDNFMFIDVSDGERFIQKDKLKHYM